VVRPNTTIPIATTARNASVSFLVFQGQGIFYLASDPRGQGSDLFGTAGTQINYGLIGAETFWYIQVALVVLGHVGALVLAHDRAVAIYEDPRQATRSRYWMLAVMIGVTSLALLAVVRGEQGMTEPGPGRGSPQRSSATAVSSAP
jgi:hypothetical protein